jgi:hypothetical protein
MDYQLNVVHNRIHSGDGYSIWFLDQIVVLKSQSHKRAFLFFKKKTMTPKVQVFT